MIGAIEAYAARIPMQRPFVHAGKRRNHTASVLVSVDAGGQRGWGEAAPRPYVTGETVQSVLDALARVEPAAVADLIDLTDFATAVRGLAAADLIGLLGGGRPMPSAAAALEIALFDLACRLHGQAGFTALQRVPATAGLLRQAPVAVPVSYVLDLARDPVEAVAALHPDSIPAIRHVKLKATADADACVRRTAAVRDLFGPHTQLSVDVNGDWDGSSAVRTASRLRELDVAWVEEPVTPRDWAAMRNIRLGAGMPVMLDESCTGLADLRTAAEEQAADYVNARVSKCGGILPTLALIATARELGLGAQLGVHVGEVGPLWAAARLLACSVAGLATAEAGKQDEWFPEPLTDPPYAVDRRGYLASPLDGVGIGLIPNAVLLGQCSPQPQKAGAA